MFSLTLSVCVLEDEKDKLNFIRYVAHKTTCVSLEGLETHEMIS
jgi:hypothetical protein